MITNENAKKNENDPGVPRTDVAQRDCCQDLEMLIYDGPTVATKKEQNFDLEDCKEFCIKTTDCNFFSYRKLSDKAV